MYRPQARAGWPLHLTLWLAVGWVPLHLAGYRWRLLLALAALVVALPTLALWFLLGGPLHGAIAALVTWVARLATFTRQAVTILQLCLSVSKQAGPCASPAPIPWRLHPVAHPLAPAPAQPRAVAAVLPCALSSSMQPVGHA